eukprot:GFUD01076165.1.p1 GENE.GFUD01076165.1~~GFUD01076165.1.p1  ORF type:complete len:350 (+),score=83.13 GFUD01076165.1:56-1105(+)
MSSEKFCLRWNDFESNISVAFRELRDDKDFFDVTLACDDEQIQAHKVILSACSPFFRNILRRNPHQHPLLYLKGVKYTDLQSVLNFMYHGEVNVAQEELNSFLAVAEDLRVKGLTQGPASASANSSKPKPDSRPRPRSPQVSRPVSPPALKRHRAANLDDDIQEVVQLPVKAEPVDHIQQLTLPPVPQQPAQPKYYSPQPTKVSVPAPATPQPNYSAVPSQQLEGYSTPTNQLASYTTDYDEQQDESYEDYGQYEEEYNGQGAGQSAAAGKDYSSLLENVVESSLTKQGSVYSCNLCGKECRDLTRGREHLEAKHYPSSGYSCPHCSKHCKTKHALTCHISVYHRGPNK